MAAFAPDKGSATALHDAVREVVAPAVASAQLFLEDIVLSAVGNRTVVEIVVDLPEDQTGGLSLDSLGDVSRAISAVLDEADPISGEYTLEVSTPGLSRPLTDRRHFARARGRLVTIVRNAAPEITGRVMDVTASEVIVSTEPDGAEVSVALNEVSLGRIELEFRRSEADETTEENEEG